MAKRILIVEDEKNIVDILSFNLGREGYQTLEAYDGDAGLQLALEQDPDLILLDLMLPKRNGFDVCRSLRAQGRSTPVIMLTAREEETDKVLGLELGADDYITKPFSFKEMVMRVGAQLRRYYEFNAVPSGDRHYGSLMISSSRYEAKVDGEPLNLTAKEFKILDYLTIHENQIMPKQKLIDDVWGVDEYIDENTVAVTIARLRDKLSKVGISNVVTVWGLGYKWQD